MRLLLLRHGQTPSNVIGSLDTAAPGPGLTDLGRQQAEAVVGVLGHEPIAGIYVSRLRRTHETAAPLARELGLEPVELPGLHEVEAGEVEGKSDRDSARRYMRTIFAWSRGDLATAMPGGYDGHEFFARFDASIAQAADAHDPDATIVAVSHGAAIRTWSGVRAANLGPDFVGEHHLENTGLVVLEGSPSDGWYALSWGGTPVGGLELADSADRDVTGETTEDEVSA